MVGCFSDCTLIFITECMAVSDIIGVLIVLPEALSISMETESEKALGCTCLELSQQPKTPSSGTRGALLSTYRVS